MSASSRHGPRPPAPVSLITKHVHATSAHTLLLMNCGFLLPALNTSVYNAAGAVYTTDRHVLAVEAARVTLARDFRGSATPRAAAGLGTYALEGAVTASIVVIRLPREKAALLQLLHDAFGVLTVGGRCFITGATNEGIKTASRLMHELFGNSEVLDREDGHRIVVSLKRSPTPVDNSSFADPLLDPAIFRAVPVTVRGHAFTMYTRPGVFSWDHLDDATALLAEVALIDAGHSVLDMGCGAGALGVVAATLGASDVVMVDADVEAVRCARRTMEAAGFRNAHVLPSDVAAAVIDRRFDVVLTNPPFHTGKATDLDLPRRFIHDAWTVLRSGGTLYLVANRTLPYEAEIRAKFGNVTAARETTRFKVLKATRQ